MASCVTSPTLTRTEQDGTISVTTSFSTSTVTSPPTTSTIVTTVTLPCDPLPVDDPPPGDDDPPPGDDDPPPGDDDPPPGDDDPLPGDDDPPPTEPDPPPTEPDPPPTEPDPPPSDPDPPPPSGEAPASRIQKRQDCPVVTSTTTTVIPGTTSTTVVAIPLTIAIDRAEIVTLYTTSCSYPPEDDYEPRPPTVTTRDGQTTTITRTTTTMPVYTPRPMPTPTHTPTHTHTHTLTPSTSLIYTTTVTTTDSNGSSTVMPQIVTTIISIQESSQASPSSSEDDGDNNLAAIVGGVVGGIAGLLLLLGVIYFWRRSHRREREDADEAVHWTNVFNGAFNRNHDLPAADPMAGGGGDAGLGEAGAAGVGGQGAKHGGFKPDSGAYPISVQGPVWVGGEGGPRMIQYGGSMHAPYQGDVAGDGVPINTGVGGDLGGVAYHPGGAGAGGLGGQMPMWTGGSGGAEAVGLRSPHHPVGGEMAGVAGSSGRKTASMWTGGGSESGFDSSSGVTTLVHRASGSGGGADMSRVSPGLAMEAVGGLAATSANGHLGQQENRQPIQAQGDAGNARAGAGADADAPPPEYTEHPSQRQGQ